MPCFKGLAVSIHTPEGPIPEFSIQRQTRHSRITSYIPVPPAKVPPNSLTNKPEQSTFAISVTLLTPGQTIPYSTPQPTEDDPFPRPRFVGGLPGYGTERGRFESVVNPYLPLTTSPNETIAAYIYFDGRTKEEVATLLRRGEETWVNSRWVSIPDEEGGGLAEREFLFREVGLERWLNGLDLEGNDAAAKTERRRVRMEKKRLRRKQIKKEDAEMDTDTQVKQEEGLDTPPPGQAPNDTDSASLSDSSSDEEPPTPEAAGQIKIALFRVLASGEIRRGEYSPQFDAHDDDEEAEGGAKTETGVNGGGTGEADIDHTTSFAKPKALDPTSISTQTVTGIDGPDKPYAVFTFLYRGERQLQKMGILPKPAVEKETPATATKRRSVQTDFSKLAPLKSGGTVGFSAFRDNESTLPQLSYGKKGKKGRSSADSDEDDDDDGNEIVGKMEDVETKTGEKDLLSVEDAERQGELAEGVRKIKLKRVHSAEPLHPSANPRKSPSTETPTSGQSPPDFPRGASLTAATPPTTSYGLTSTAQPTPSSAIAATLKNDMNPAIDDGAIVGSPMKKSRPSLPYGEEGATIHDRLGLGLGLGGTTTGGGSGAPSCSPSATGDASTKLSSGFAFGDGLGAALLPPVDFGGTAGKTRETLGGRAKGVEGSSEKAEAGKKVQPSSTGNDAHVHDNDDDDDEEL